MAMARGLYLRLTEVKVYQCTSQLVNCRQGLGKTYVMAGMVGFADYEAESNTSFQISRQFFGRSMSMSGSGLDSNELTSADCLLGRPGWVQPRP